MSETEQPETSPTAEEIAAAANLNPSAMIVQAVIQSFWNPVPIGYSMESQPYAPNGMPQMVPVPQYGVSPLSKVARVLFDTFGDKIIEKVTAEVDLEALAEKIAVDVHAKLAKEPKNSFGSRERLTPTAQRVRDLVEKRVAEKLSDQVQADYNAQQAAMLAAWHEKMERDRNRGQLYGGSGNGAPAPCSVTRPPAARGVRSERGR